VQQCSGACSSTIVHNYGGFYSYYYGIEEREKPGVHNSFFTVMLVEAALQWERG